MKKVVLERNLGNVEKVLKENKVDFIYLDEVGESERKMNKGLAVILSGDKENFMGMQDALTKNVVINADGKSAIEVYNELIARSKKM